MYFYKEDGKQCLDLKGDLILSFNDELIKTRVKSAAPVTVKAPDGFVLNIGKLGFIKRIKLVINVTRFVFGKARELKREDTNYRESHRANVVNDINDCQCEDDNGNKLNKCDDCPR